MKTLSKLIKIEMSNIHFLKPDKNFFKKEMICISCLFFLVVIYGYVFMNQISDIQIKQKSIVVVLLMAFIASLYDFLLRANTILYDYNEYRMISYLPVGSFQIILAKLISMAMVIWRWQMIIGFSFSIVYVLMMHFPIMYLFTCFILLVSGSLLICFLGGLLVMLFNKNKVLGLVCSSLLLLTLGAWISRMPNIFENANFITQILGEFVSIFVSAFINAFLILGLAYLIKIDYVDVLSKVEQSIKYEKKMKSSKRNISLSNALYLKEKKAFWSLKVYMINIMAFVVIFSFGLLASCFVPSNMVTNILIQTGYEREISFMLPMILSFVFGMSCPTYCSLSLEGKAIDLLKSKPMYFSNLICSKLKFYIMLMLPFIFVDAFILEYLIKRKVFFGEVLLLIIFPLIFSIVVGIIGIWLDIIFGSFEWINPISVVKQSITLPLMMMFNVILIGIPVGLEFILHLEKLVLYIIVGFIWSLIGVVFFNLAKSAAKRKLGI